MCQPILTISENNSISIDRQMQYQNGLIKLVPLKTRNAKRTVYMNKMLKEHLQKQWQQSKRGIEILQNNLSQL